MILTRNHAELTFEVKKHIEADAVIQGDYWDGSKGCFIGCLTHSRDPALAFERFGLPEPLLRIAENIFEALPSDDARAFFAALPDAVACDGKDLSLVHWSFLAAEMRALPTVPDQIQRVIDQVIAGMDTLAHGGEWCKDTANDVAHAALAAANAARGAALAAANAAYAADVASSYTANAAPAYAGDAAANAAYVARTANAAACASYAANTAAYVARATVGTAVGAAAYATRIRQRDSLLRLISEAPIGEPK